MPFGTAVLFSGIGGFIALSYEILWMRFFSFATGSAPAIFGLLLGMYLVGIALGARRVKNLFQRSRTENIAALGDLIVLVNISAYICLPIIAHLTTLTRLFSYLGLILIIPLAGFLGAIFPILSHVSIESTPGVGLRVSYLYVSNILGSTIGTILTGFFLLDTFSFSAVSAIISITGIILGLCCYYAVHFREVRKSLLCIGLSSCIAVPMSITPLYSNLFTKLLYKESFGNSPQIVQHVENRHGIISINSNGVVYGSGIFDGTTNTSLRDDRNVNGIERAYLISMIHPSPKRVLEIGLSIGSWAQVFVEDPRVEKLTSIEINPGYLELIEQQPVLKGLLKNRKITINIDDGRRWLMRHPNEQFDLISMNTAIHWRNNATNVLSRDFFLLLKNHLLPNGIIFVNSTGCRDVATTVADVYPYVYLYGGMVMGSNDEIKDRRKDFAKYLGERVIDSEYTLEENPLLFKGTYSHLMSFEPVNQKQYILSHFNQ
ncbi:MAG: hypothetical protein IT291_09760, partial [Deltaproteobacteria bacterium]|nr:hypothetical protein [Deltaproteobacteria bacterium]